MKFEGQNEIFKAFGSFDIFNRERFYFQMFIAE